MKSPRFIRSLTIKFAVALALVATPVAALSLTNADTATVSFAGGSYPDDIDPG